MRSRLLALFFLSTVTVSLLPALDPSKTVSQYVHRIWGQEEGLFQPTIYSILQTSDGFIWLGTQDSLIRFDGMHFREFEKGGQPVFSHSLIRSLVQDRRGNLWVGSVGSGVAEVRPDGTVHRYSTKQGLPNDNVFCLASDSKDRIWMCTSQGLARLDNGHFRVFTTADGLPSDDVHSTCEAPDGTRWVAGFDSGLSRWNGSRFEAFSDPNVAPRENITALECGKDGSIWVGSDDGLTQIRDGKSRAFTSRDGLPDDAVSSLAQGPHGSLWVGTNDGVSRYRNGEFSVYRTQDGLSHSLVLALYADREGSLWAGTKDGLDEFTDGKVTPYTTNEGLTGNDSGPVLQDAAGLLWIGTLGKGLNSFDGHRFRSVTMQNGLSSDTVLSLASDSAGDLWVGTDRGLNRLHDRKVIASYAQKDGLSGLQVQALFVDERGMLWAGTNRGLHEFDGRRFVKSQVEPKLASSDASDGVVALMGGRSVSMFISTDAGKLYYAKDGIFSSYSLNGVIRPVDCHYTDVSHHTAWFGTLGSGLLRWQNGKLSRIRVKDGLYDNRIYSILADDNFNLWMASSKGIFRVSEKDLDDFAEGKTRNVTSIPFSTGQLRFECQSGVQPAGYRTRDGRLWFSTTNGLVVVDPNHLLSNSVPPPVEISSVIIDGQRLDSTMATKLKPSQKNVEIRYAGLSFVAPERVTFRYILDGFDKTWTDAGSRREAFFTNLPPGNFHFRVMARNADGVWSREAASLNLTVEPRFYQRLWFFPALAVLLGMAILCGYRVRIRQLKNRFDLVIAERTRIARELHDTLLQGLSGITMQMQALWTRLPSSNEKHVLSEIIGDAGRCSREARQSLWGLRASGSEPAGFHEKLARMSQQALSGSAVSLDLQLEAVNSGLSPEIEFQLMRIAHEAITNTLKHAHAKTLRIILRSSIKQLELSLVDDGDGFAVSRSAEFGHFGLIGIRERAHEIGAHLQIQSSPGSGTQLSVSVALPQSGPTETNAERGVEHQLR